MIEKFQVTEDCVIDFSRHKIYKNEAEVALSSKITAKAWAFLYILVEADGRILTYNYLNDDSGIWPDDIGLGIEHRGVIKGWASAFNKAFGKKCIECKNDLGYSLEPKISFSDSSDEDVLRYFEALWQKHHLTDKRDDPGGRLRELLDVYICPKLKEGENIISEPFSEEKCRRVITAGSGIGKTFLLKSLLLLSIADALCDNGSAVCDEKILEKIKKGAYKETYESFFGKKGKPVFPVFISADDINKKEITSIPALAKINTGAVFEKTLRAISEKYNVLFLIDSIDEIKSQDKKDIFFEKLEKFLGDFAGCSVIITSRFAGKISLPCDFEELELCGFDETDIETLAERILLEDKKELFLKNVRKNKYLMELAGNPFFLMHMLSSPGAENPIPVLYNVVGGILRHRWEERYRNIFEETKLMLGYIALYMILKNKENLTTSEMKSLFYEAKNEIHSLTDEGHTLHGMSDKEFSDFVEMLPCQSGILNLKYISYDELYFFQDRLVMCYLAGYCFSKIVSHKMKNNRNVKIGDRVCWENTFWLYNFTEEFSKDNAPLGDKVLKMLIVSLSLLNIQYQIVVICYLLFRNSISVEADEKRVIREAFEDILGSKIGTNNVANDKDDEICRLIKQVLGK